ncbi:FAD:protein FMN transferase [Deinococcus roseus]|uniref:FAD:protein FMN transferase n=1 Tax=Deinococcus roseus TaxID=392414 RepID=A0ABQ2D089_9DEIO|nr:FAD:protein FMN transferase [Deinococcus roseus]GGJ31779.1 FAD:protein FMN transferase [Deinococcus roseus]
MRFSCGCSHTHVRHFDHVLGTALEIQLQTSHKAAVQVADQAILKEIDRLEGVFSRFLPSSELNTLLNHSGQKQTLSSEMAWLLHTSQKFSDLTGNAYHPAADQLWQMWKQASNLNELPEYDFRLPASDLWSFHAEQDVTLHHQGTLNFNALAKGRIADLAAQKGHQVEGVQQTLVNLGGDLRHLGSHKVLVQIENPFSPFDQNQPVSAVFICNQGVATSGPSRRSFQVAGQQFNHIFDPRTGRPVQHLVSATVLAPDCATADVLSTAFSVLQPAESLALADTLPDIGCLLITREGEIFSNAFWDQHIPRTSSQPSLFSRLVRSWRGFRKTRPPSRIPKR